MPAPRTVIAVEGTTDRVVLETIASRQGLLLPGVDIIPIGGARAIRRFVASLDPDVTVRGLCDANEAPVFRRVLADVFVCAPDLEGELIRAIGADQMLALVDDSFRVMQMQAAHRDRPLEAQLHRWLRSIAERRNRYLPLLAEHAVDVGRVPEPLAAVLA